MSSAAEDAKKRIKLGIKVTIIVLVVGGLIFAVDKGFDIGIYSAIGAGIGSISSGGGGGGGVSAGAGGGGAGGAGGGMGIILLIAAVLLLLLLGKKGLGGIGRWRARRRDPGGAPEIPLAGEDDDAGEDDEVPVPADAIPEVPAERGAVRYDAAFLDYDNLVKVENYVNVKWNSLNGQNKNPLFELVRGSCDNSDEKLYLNYRNVFNKDDQDISLHFIEKDFEEIDEAWQIGRKARRARSSVRGFTKTREFPYLWAFSLYYSKAIAKVPDDLWDKIELTRAFKDNIWPFIKEDVLNKKKPIYEPEAVDIKNIEQMLKVYNKHEVRGTYDKIKTKKDIFNNKPSVFYPKFTHALQSYLWDVFIRAHAQDIGDFVEATHGRVPRGDRITTVDTIGAHLHRWYHTIDANERAFRNALSLKNFSRVRGTISDQSSDLSSVKTDVDKYSRVVLNLAKVVAEHDDETIKQIIKDASSRPGRTGNEIDYMFTDEELDVLVKDVHNFSN
ncbi:MAG: hypothetical protein QF858_02120, partial [Candidatus Pacebacteria bacterium]|nr:hypothetical protein [Candidatus Paceibacterota bacterium]